VKIAAVRSFTTKNHLNASAPPHPQLWKSVPRLLGNPLISHASLILSTSQYSLPLNALSRYSLLTVGAYGPMIYTVPQN